MDAVVVEGGVAPLLLVLCLLFLLLCHPFLFLVLMDRCQVQNVHGDEAVRGAVAVLPRPGFLLMPLRLCWTQNCQVLLLRFNF